MQRRKKRGYLTTATYCIGSLILIVVGSSLVRYSLFPPYIANTYRLFDLISQSEIENPLPASGNPAASKKLPTLPIVPFYNNIGFVLLGLFLLGIGFLLAYFFPAFVGRTHRDHLSIYILNLFLGWSFLGWVIALIWAVTKDPIFLVEPPEKEISTQLKELGKLRQEGILAEAEFKKVKAKLLSQPKVPPSPKKTGGAVKTVCPHCAREYRVRPTLVGRMASCKNCGKRFKL